MLISCHSSVSPLLSTKAFTPAGDARARDTPALSLVPWSSSRQRENFLLNLWSLPICAVIRAAQQWWNCQHKGGKIEWSCECRSLPSVLRVCWVKEEHDPQATCPFFTLLFLWNLGLLLLPGRVPKGSSSPGLTHALLTLLSPTSTGESCTPIVLGMGDTLIQVACKWKWKGHEKMA